MSAAANVLRGEAELRVGARTFVLRPSFAALVAAEGELGPLFALVERAADGRLALGELASLFWHLAGSARRLTRAAVGRRWWRRAGGDRRCACRWGSLSGR